MGGFGTTWWGTAWLDAVEGIAGGRGTSLARGRRRAREQRTTELAIGPGRVDAWIDGDRDDPYEVGVAIRPFRDDEWDAVLEAIGAKASHAAALLDGELDPAVIDDAAAVEVDLLPRPRDLQTICTCPDDAEPCEHAAAVCYLLADALDADPFVLLLLRGRRREEILDGVRRARTGRDPASVATREAVAEIEEPISQPGMAVAEAWARELGELPAVPMLTNTPSRPAAWPTDPPAHAPFDGAGLRALVADAARRAWELAAGTVDAHLDLDARADLARRAVGASPALRELLATRAGVPAVELDVLAAAWQFGGPAGVVANDEERWQPPTAEMREARAAIIEAGLVERRVHISGNRITAEGRLQFRRASDGCWYLFTKSTGRWTLSSAGERRIDDLLEIELFE